jgi:8-oxo-dGTP pyrophosphatase MutT (NUDIX family)
MVLTVTVLGSLLLGACSSGDLDVPAAPVSTPASPAAAPDTPTEVLSALYRTIEEPFTATFTYTRSTDDENPDETETYVAIETTITQDAESDILVTESGRWAEGSADHALVDGSLYVRTSVGVKDYTAVDWKEYAATGFNGDEYVLDVAGVDAHTWLPYYDWEVLAREVSEEINLRVDKYAPSVSPERPYKARNPLSVMEGEQFLPPPSSCVTFMTGLPEGHVRRLDDNRWQIKCETSLATVDEFIVEFDSSGRLVRFANPEEFVDGYQLVITYGPVPDVEKPDLSWWEENQSLVRERIDVMVSKVWSED